MTIVLFVLLFHLVLPGVQVDPAKPIIEQAEALYKKAGKARRAGEVTGPLMEAARQEASYMGDLLVSIEQLGEDGPDLAALRGIQVRGL